MNEDGVTREWRDDANVWRKSKHDRRMCDYRSLGKFDGKLIAQRKLLLLANEKCINRVGHDQFEIIFNIIIAHTVKNHNAVK